MQNVDFTCCYTYIKLDAKILSGLDHNYSVPSPKSLNVVHAFDIALSSNHIILCIN